MYDRSSCCETTVQQLGYKSVHRITGTTPGIGPLGEVVAAAAAEKMCT